VGAVDGVPVPGEPSPPERPNGRERDQPRQVLRELPDPDERSRVYAATRAAADEMEYATADGAGREAPERAAAGRAEEGGREPDRPSGPSGRPDMTGAAACTEEGPHAGERPEGGEGPGTGGGPDTRSRPYAEGGPDTGGGPGMGEQHGADSAGASDWRGGSPDRHDGLPERYEGFPDRRDNPADRRAGLATMSRGAYYEALKAKAEALDGSTPSRDGAPRGGPEHRVLHQPDQADRKAEARPSDYWNEVPRFFAKWAEHERRWPRPEQAEAATERRQSGTAQDQPQARADGHHAAERQAEAADDQGRPDAAGERHEPNTAGEQRPSDAPAQSPEARTGPQDALARSRPGLDAEMMTHIDDVIGRIPDAEKAISEDIQTVERTNRSGAWLEGFEHRLKGEERLKEKITDALSTSAPDATPEDVLRKVPDAIRYTFCLKPKDYAKGYYESKQRLESSGFEMYQSKNFWTDPEYKGINTRWVTPDGQRFEVQFHTPESFHAKHHVTHKAYERIRDPNISKAELRELHAFQREVSRWIHIPEDVINIPDFKKEGF